MTDNHWYPHYIGDYIKDTSHLSLTEHGAYRVLLDHYYSTKQPLPANAELLHRICRAFAEHEQKAVNYVIKTFFTLKADFYHNKRADREISKRQAISKVRSKAANIKHNKHYAHAEQMQSTCSPFAATATATATATESSSSAKGDFERIYDVGCHLFPQLAPQSTSAIHQWLSAGCSVELDIIPEMTRQIGRSPRGWGYFTGSVMDAKATREKPPPVGVSRNYGRPKESPKANVRTL